MIGIGHWQKRKSHLSRRFPGVFKKLSFPPQNSIVGALSFVKEHTEIPANTLWAGTPAKQLRELSEKEVGWKSRGTAIYHHLAQQHLATEQQVDPLASVDEARRSQRVPDVLYETKKTSNEG